MASAEVTKLDAARRQLDAAIRMHLIHEEPLAIHTLVMAVFQVLRDLAKVNSEATFHTMLEAQIRPGKQQEFWSRMKAPANFLKHADKDPNGVMREVSSDGNGHLILLSCMLLRELGVTSPETAVFIPLHMTLFPDIAVEDHTSPFGDLMARLQHGAHSISREEHFAVVREVIQRIKAQT